MKITFRYRLLASYILLIAVPLLVLGALFYRTSLKIITEQAQKNVYEIVKKITKSWTRSCGSWTRTACPYFSIRICSAFSASWTPRTKWSFLRRTGR